LTKRGHVRSTGRPWAWNDPKTGSRKTAKNRLHDIFHHPFYAGWGVSDRFNIKMGEIKGKWKPAVTTDQFERGKQILRKHDHNKSRQKRLHYLLRNLLWVQVGKKQLKMYGSTPTGRYQSYSYYITHAKPDGNAIRLKTDIVDEQIGNWVSGVVVSPDLIPEIQEAYRSQLKKVTQDDQDETLNQLRRRLTELQEEETRLGRLIITGQISDDAYARLRSEWSEKVFNIQRKIEELEFDASQYLDDLEVALVLMTNISTLYGRLEEQQRTNLLQMFVKRIIINREGEIIGHELLSPFEYLSTLANCSDSKNEEGGGSEQVRYGSLGKLPNVGLF
jgi:hypothetical protein